jgi:hypothetical protein
MTTTLTKIKAPNDLPHAGRRRRHRVEVRRVAVIRPEGAHFTLRPIRASRQTA